jgi:Tfp pilus assembly protein PilX
MKSLAQQRGSTLLVSLIMLVLLTLVAVSAIESTTSGIQVVGNAQFREEATAAAQQAIENVISTTSFTTATPANQTIDVNNDGTADYTVTFSPAPSCSKYKAVDTSTETGLPKDCYGSTGALCYRTYWDITAVVNDATTGTKVTLHQGVKLLVGLNAALASCA